MNTVEFLRSIWPTQGIYCIATYPHPHKVTGLPTVWQKNFATIEDAAAYATVKKHDFNVYHANFSFKALSAREGPRGSYTTLERTAANAAFTRVFFDDLDCGKAEAGKAPKYASQADAVVGLKRYLKATGLPRPMVVNSGYGLHVYYRISEDVSAEDWRRVALKLKRLDVYHGLLADPVVTTDLARILRPVGTFNRKNKDDPRKVALGAPAETVTLAEFEAIVDAAVALLPEVVVTDTPDFEREEAPHPKLVAETCATFARMVEQAPAASEPVWKATLELVRHTTGGRKLAHKLSSAHPDYHGDVTNAALDRFDGLDLGPPTCRRLEALYGADSPCPACAHYGRPTSSPVVFARRKPETELPPEIPQPMKPFSRTKRGIEHQLDPTDAGPNPPSTVIYPYDLYPTRIVDDPIKREKRIEWVTVVPIRGEVVISLSISAYTNEDKLISDLVNQGATVDKRHGKLLGVYMSQYIRQLQAASAEHTQVTNFGFTLDGKSFVMPHGAITATGTREVVLSGGMVNAAQGLGQSGTLEGQVKALAFFDDPAYVRQQFVICAALAAPLLFLTGYYGLIMNLSGASGVGKSTVMVAGASHWGRPEKFMLNGTISGFTANARMARLEVLASLPVFLDETTNISAEVIKEMTMGVTQSGGRGRLDRNGVERVMPDVVKSTIMITSSNNNMHAMLSQNNQAGDAGSMRMFQVDYPPPKVHSKAQADAALRAFRQHHGHTGPAMIRHYLRNPEAVRAKLEEIIAEVDRRGNIQSPERFWSTGICIALLGAALGKELGLLDYDAARMMDWALNEQLPEMRNTVVETYQTPVAHLQSFMADVANNLLVVAPRDSTGHQHIIRHPRGPLEGRLEPQAMKLYIPVHVLRRYCDKFKINYDPMVRELQKLGVVTRTKMDITRYCTEYVSGLATCVRIDCDHELMSGAPPIQAQDGAQVLNFRGPGTARSTSA